jgi:hypothetical protein
MDSARTIAFLLMVGGAVLGTLGALHALYTLLDLHTLLDLRNPRRPVALIPAPSPDDRT